MRAVSFSLLAGTTLFLTLLSTATPAQAQFFYEGPQKPEVEVDLSVLDDPSQAPSTPQAQPYYPQGYQQQPPVTGEFPAPITATVPPVPVERTPLAPIRSPYENSRVVDRIELEGANPYIGKPAPSPFAPAAIIKPPKPRVDMPRTAPATIIKPHTPTPLEGGAPLVVEAEPELMHPDDGVEMPPINVSNAIRDQQPRTAPAAAQKKISVQKPKRKPAVLSLASEASETPPRPIAKPAALIKTAAAATTEPAITTVPEAPPLPPPAPAPVAEIIPPEVKKSAESVIDDLYTLPPHQQPHDEQVDLAAMSIDAPIPLPEDVAPPLMAPPAQPQDAKTVSGSIVFPTGDGVTLDDSMHREIDRMADLLGDSETSRLLVKGYARGVDGNRATARRLSVSRAHAVRAYLMDKGIKPSRVDIRGMGSESTDQNASLDRVDLVLVP